MDQSYQTLQGQRRSGKWHSTIWTTGWGKTVLNTYKHNMYYIYYLLYIYCQLYASYQYKKYASDKYYSNTKNKNTNNKNNVWCSELPLVDWCDKSQCSIFQMQFVQNIKHIDASWSIVLRYWTYRTSQWHTRPFLLCLLLFHAVKCLFVEQVQQLSFILSSVLHHL